MYWSHHLLPWKYLDMIRSADFRNCYVVATCYTHNRFKCCCFSLFCIFFKHCMNVVSPLSIYWYMWILNLKLCYLFYLYFIWWLAVINNTFSLITFKRILNLYTHGVNYCAIPKKNNWKSTIWPLLFRYKYIHTKFPEIKPNVWQLF